jgi:hypothetical protein
MASIVDQLRQAIQTSWKTRYRLALESQTNQSTLARFIRGERGLNLETAARLCEVLGLKLRLARRRMKKVEAGPQPVVTRTLKPGPIERRWSLKPADSVNVASKRRRRKGR